jgi:hypothetical protein
VKSTPAKKQFNSQKKETTRSITYRLPSKIVEELETEAMNKKISQNVLVKQILEKYVNWDRFSDKIGMVPIPKGILDSLGAEMNGDDINEITKIVLPIIKDAVLFMKGKYDLKRCIETLEDYLRASGMKSDHRIEGELHHFIIQHELGMNWSFFTEQLLKEIFNQFMPTKNIKFQTTKNTVIATISLGSDFNEHDY